MSKTFNSMYPDSVLSLRIGSNHDGSGVHVAVLGASGLQLAKPDAPALALAILEAAGHRPVAYDPERLSGDDLLAYIAHKLAVHVRDEDKRAKVAADREALEGEARGLRAAHSLDEKHMAWEHLAPLTRKRWEKAALKARELHGGTK